MAEGEFPKRLQLPRILERRRAPAAFQLEATHGESGNEIEAFDSPTNEADTRGHRGGETNTEATSSLREAKRQPPLPVDEIATVIQSLTYGEMIEISEAMWKTCLLLSPATYPSRHNSEHAAAPGVGSLRGVVRG
jgi:hypothetical protein